MTEEADWRDERMAHMEVERAARIAECGDLRRRLALATGRLAAAAVECEAQAEPDLATVSDAELRAELASRGIGTRL